MSCKSNNWIERLEKEYGVSYQSFCKNVFTLTLDEISNLRTKLPERALVILSNGTGVPIDNLRKRDLYKLQKIMYAELSELLETYPEEFSNFLFPKQ